MSRGTQLERTNRLHIRTPDGVTFSYSLAGPMTRFLAWLLDAFISLLITNAIMKLLDILHVISSDVATAMTILAAFVVPISYGIIMEWFWRGQTFGKKTLRIRVMDEQGLHLQFSQVVIRNLLRIADSLPLLYMVGGLVTLLTARCQRLGDLAAGTVVVSAHRTENPDVTSLVAGKYNSLREHPHLASRLQQRISPREAAVAVRALIRREELQPAARIALFEDLASHFKSLVNFPQEATDGVSDEQFVRNVVDVVFRAAR